MTLGLPFALAVLGAMAAMALLGAAAERAIVRPLVGRPVFAVTMVSLGLLILLEQLGGAVWGYDPIVLGDPWGIDTVAAGAVAVKVADLWTIGAAGVVLATLWAFFTFSVRGVAMRATADDRRRRCRMGSGRARCTASPGRWPGRSPRSPASSSPRARRGSTSRWGPSRSAPFRR
jgi:branched-chain amino acid transport system permease protein